MAELCWPSCGPQAHHPAWTQLHPIMHALLSCCSCFLPIPLQVASLERRLGAVESREASLMAELRSPPCGTQHMILLKHSFSTRLINPHMRCCFAQLRFACRWRAWSGGWLQ
jgi:hypothetical protein